MRRNLRPKTVYSFRLPPDVETDVHPDTDHHDNTLQDDPKSIVFDVDEPAAGVKRAAPARNLAMKEGTKRAANLLDPDTEK